MKKLVVLLAVIAGVVGLAAVPVYFASAQSAETAAARVRLEN